MANLTDFHPFVVPSAQGCPIAMVNNAILSSLIEFCEKTLIWRRQADPTDIEEGKAIYTFAPPTDTVISQVTFVAVDDTAIPVINVQDLDKSYAGWRYETSSTPWFFYMDSTESITLVPTPSEDKDAAMDVEVVLKPSASATTVEDFIFDNWAEVIAHGALARLHAMPGKVWADTNTVMYHRSKFREGITRAKTKAFKSYNMQSKEISPRTFWEM